MPIVMLTARTDAIDVVAGLEAGADDYVRKPYELPELLARLRVALRRTVPAGTPPLRLGSLEVGEFDLAAFVRAAVSARLPRARVSLSDAPLLVATDPRRLERVLR